MILLNEESPDDLVDEVIKMDKFAKNIQERAEHVLQNKTEYLAYIRAEQAQQDEKNRLKFAEEKGQKIGEEHGKKIAEIKGEKIGEHREKVKIAKKLKNQGDSVQKIAEITGLSITEIEKL
jgi:predicted transposase/invertase (TIGR01784 family)